MWPQLGCRQGYSEGEDGEGVLSSTLANRKTAGLGGKRGMRRTVIRQNEQTKIAASLPGSTLLLVL